ncbi:MAG: lactonase family protein [Gemmatimonadota bacterium]
MRGIPVYVGTYTNDPAEGIYHLRLDPASGALEAAGATKPVANPFFLRADSRRRRLYATTGPDESSTDPAGGVIAFAIDPGSGALTRLNQQSSEGAMPCYLDLTADGRSLLVGNYTSGSVALLPVDADGRLQPASCTIQHQGSGADPSRQEGPHVHSVVLDPAGHLAFAADLGTDQIMAYRLDAGALTAANPPFARVQAGAGPRHLAFHPNQRFAYLANELDNTFSVFAYDASRGALSAIQTISMLPAGHAGTAYAADLKILPSGDFLYGSNREHNSIVICRIDPGTGRLALVGHQPCPAWPWNLAIDPSGAILLAACQRADCVVSYRIDCQTGGLAPTGHQVSVPKPVCLEMLR